MRMKNRLPMRLSIPENKAAGKQAALFFRSIGS